MCVQSVLVLKFSKLKENISHKSRFRIASLHKAANMRAGRKLLLLLTVVFCAYIFLILHLLTPRHPPNPEDPEGRRTLRTVDSACAAAFKNPSLRKKLTRTLALGDPDRFIQLLEKYLPTCALKRTELSHAQGYGLLDPVLPTFRDPKEVSGAVLNGTTPSPPLARRNHTGRSGQDMCPRQSPLLQGQVGVQLFGELKFSLTYEVIPLNKD